MLKNFPSLFLGLLCIFIIPMHVHSQVEVQYSGCVASERITFESNPSLLQLLKSPVIQPCAYKFATALTQPRLIPLQEAQKEILLLNIRLLSLSSSSKSIKQYLSSLESLIQKQSITGRVLGLELDSTRVEIIPLKNRIFSHSLTMHFPSKLKSVFFVGAKKEIMPYRPSLSVEDYVIKNPLFNFFEKGYVSVVQANGEVEKLKVGVWNHQTNYLSPGSWIIGRLKSTVIEEVAPTFNEDLANWLATQVLP